MTEAAESAAPAESAGQVATESAPVESVLTGQATSAPEQTTEAAPEVSAEQTSQFLESLPEEYRTLAMTKGFKETGDVLKSYKEIESMVGKRFSDLTADEIRAMNTKLGAPESADGYEFNLPEGIVTGKHLQSL